MESEIKIDFVIPWVDGNDPNWRKEKNKYSPDKATDSRDIRYRDWDFLKYWFRGVEKFAPWVNKIHFVTWGHLPEWLDTSNPKLHIVKHEDYIPKEYLPTFSANPIELNFHRIEGLAEHFVYFNDDMFILKEINPDVFFKNGLPHEYAVFNPPGSEDLLFMSILYNDVMTINKHFKKDEVVKKYKRKFLSLEYGKANIRTLLCLPWKSIQGFFVEHGPSAFLKSTYETIWNEEHDLLDETSKRRFRSERDVNQHLIKFWQYCSGQFEPRKNLNISYKVMDHLDTVCDIIENKKTTFLCLNDGGEKYDFETSQKRVNECLNKILTDKSSFEK